MSYFSDQVRGFAVTVGRAGSRFARDETASMSVEAALIAPLLFWGFLATYTYFDVFRVRNVALKSNYAISDLLSREQREVNANYITGVTNLFRYLTRTNSSAWVRVSVVRCEDGCATAGNTSPGPRTLAADWSHASNGVPGFSDQDINDKLEEIVPIMAPEERLIIVETSMHYNAPFAPELTGIGDRVFNDVVITRPRFSSKLCWEGDPCD